MKPTNKNNLHKLPAENRTVSVLHITDPTAVSDSLEVLDQDVVNLGPEGFLVKRVTVPLEECCLIYQKSNASVRTLTRVHEAAKSCRVL